MIGRIARRTLLAAMFAPVPLAAAACFADRRRETAVSLPEFRQDGDTEDTEALVRAFATGRPVYAPAGRGSGPGGVYLVGNEAEATLPSGAELFGDGIGRTIVTRAGDRPFILHCDSGSADVRRNITGLRFADLSFADDVARLGFSGFSYLVMLNGVTGVRFDRVGFHGFRGDGLHLGSSVTSAIERHNRDVVVSQCLFDGVNSNNRNAISVIDVDGLIIEQSRFLNVTRAGDGSLGQGDPMDPATGLAQPGAIDLEPNADAFAVIRNVIVRDNRFEGGGGYAVSMLLLPNDFVRTPQQNILVENNRIRDRLGGFQAFGYHADGAVRNAAAYAVTFRGNEVVNCKKPFILNGMRGLLMEDNLFQDCQEHAELGYRSANAEVVLARNRFVRVGNVASGNALWIRDGTNIALVENSFVDAGIAGRRDGVAIAVVSGVVQDLTMRGNRFSSPEGRMAQSATLFRDARVNALRAERNRALGVPIEQALTRP